MTRYFAFALLATATISVAAPRVALAREPKVASKINAIEMLDIAPAIYQSGDHGFWDTKPAHDVTLSHAYRMAARPVSNAQFELFDPRHRATRAKLEILAGDDDPARFVTWQQAVNYCAWLSERTGKHYRLPSEAEWEHAFATREGKEATP